MYTTRKYVIVAACGEYRYFAVSAKFKCKMYFTLHSTL
jgi:hypothetical protein